MVRSQPIATLDLPELAPYRTMRLQEEHRRQGLFVAEGEKVVRRLLESDLEVISLLLPQKWLENYAELLARRPEKEIQAFLAEKSLLEHLTGFTMYQGVLAVGRVPRLPPFQEVLDRAEHPALIVAVEGVSNAQNMGGLIRTCAAFGANAMLLGETCCSAFLRRSVRASMGTIFKLPIVETERLLDEFAAAKARGLRIIAAHPHTNQRTLWETDFTGPCIILLGSEGEGISPGLLKACDETVAIPMRNEVDSLNVGTAGAIFLYEAARQRSISRQCSAREARGR